MHPIEQSLSKKALTYLDSVQDAEKQLQDADRTPYTSNVILIDIFVRENYAIKTDLSLNLPETHTIILWKKKDDEILLIDPSKVDFSAYIQRPLEELFNKGCKKINISIFQPLGIGKVFYGSEASKTGYTTFSEQNPSPRDCVDVAVKIGFEMQEQQRICTKLQDIPNNTLEQISNQKINASHMKLVKNNFVRTLQSSNHQIRVIAKDTLKAALYEKNKLCN